MAYNFRERFSGLLPGGFWPSWMSQMPFVDFHQMDLDWILRAIRAVLDQMKYYFIDGGSKETIEEVMEEHPEWWPRVQDGAITSAQINSEFLNEIENPYITPQMFGAVGDGITDDTDAIQNCINSVSIGTIFFPNGIYKVTSSIIVKHSDQSKMSHTIRMDRNAVLKAGVAMDAVLHFQKDTTHINNNMRDYLDGEMLEGGNIDGNGLASYGVIFDGNGRMSCHDTNVYDATVANVWIKEGRFNAWNMEISNNFNYALHDSDHENVIGILNDSDDSHFWDIYLSWCKYGIVNNKAGFYERVHGVMGNYGYVGSIFVQQGNDNISTYINCYSDNYHTAYKTTGSCTFINPVAFYWMTAAELAAHTKPKVFDLSGLNVSDDVIVDGLNISPSDRASQIIGVFIGNNNIRQTLQHTAITNIITAYTISNRDWLAYYVGRCTDNNAITDNIDVYGGKYIHLFDVVCYNFYKSLDINCSISNKITNEKFKAKLNLHVDSVPPDAVLSASALNAYAEVFGATGSNQFLTTSSIETMDDGANVAVIGLWFKSADTDVGPLLFGKLEEVSANYCCVPIRLNNTVSDTTPSAVLTTNATGYSITYYELPCEIGSNGSLVRFTTPYSEAINPVYTPSITINNAALICNGSYNPISGTTRMIQKNTNSTTWEISLSTPHTELNNHSGVIRLSCNVAFT